MCIECKKLTWQDKHNHHNSNFVLSKKYKFTQCNPKFIIKENDKCHNSKVHKENTE